MDATEPGKCYGHQCCRRFSQGKENVQGIFLDWAFISLVILSCFNTRIEIKTMTTAPSAPATATPPWLASHLQQQKACPREEAKSGEFSQGALFYFYRIQARRAPGCKDCQCRSGVRCATAERLPLLPQGTGRGRTGCPEAGLSSDAHCPQQRREAQGKRLKHIHAGTGITSLPEKPQLTTAVATQVSAHSYDKPSPHSLSTVLISPSHYF